MRLTLRTMLAYLDEVLEPADAADLSKKIEESEFASNLVAKIRASISHPRLAAPPVDGKGTGRDANSVAEYLDSTLPADKVPDFERICLESDAHLAEVAACHQILTLVLGKPAAVPGALRERAYRYGSNLAPGATHESNASAVVGREGHRLDQAHAAPAAQAGVDITAEGSPQHAAEGRKRSGSKPEVPEYLREGRRKSQLTTLAVAACILLILGGVGAFAAVSYFGGGLAAVTPEAEGDSAAEPSAGTPAENEEPSREGNAGDNEGPASARPVSPPAEEPAPAAVAPAESAPAENRPATDVNPPVEPEPEDVPPTAPAEPAEPMPEPVSPEPTAPEPVTDVPPSVDPVPPVGPAEPEPVTEELSPIDVGRYLSGDKVLARQTPEGGWLRLTANTPLRSGDRVLALPAYRPQIALISGITLTLDGPARLEFLRAVNEQESLVKLDYGRLLAITVNPEGAVIGLHAGKLQGKLRLADADTMLAVEAEPVLIAGSNPLETESSLLFRLICLSGRVDWIASDGVALAIPGGEQFSVVEGGPGQISKLDMPPAWVDDKAVSLTDRDAARMIEPRLEADRPLELSLAELATGPRADLRALAVRGLAYLDNHDLLIPAFNDNAQRSSWAAEFDAAQHALARSRESAEALKQSLETQRGGNAEELFRLLWGYSNEDLEAGADAKLVEYLDHDAQEFRVLAIENLRRITGATHLYRPEYNPQRRRMYIQAWRKDLEAGLIRHPEAEE